MIYSLKKGTLIEIPSISYVEAQNRIQISYKGEYLTDKFLYYIIMQNDFVCGFDFFELIAYYKSINKINFDKSILSYFVKYGYAPFDYTFISDIYKLPNMTTLIVEPYSLKTSYNLCDFVINKNSDADVLSNAIRGCLDQEHKNIILFSGGYDSTLISVLAKKYCRTDNLELATGQLTGVHFVPNEADFEYSSKLSQQIGIKHQIINVNIDDITNKDFEHIIFNQPNSAHFSLMYYKIQLAYQGLGYNFVSGQQADSILNFGSTSFLRFHIGHIEGAGELIRRFLYLSNIKYADFLFRILNRELYAKQVQLSLLCGNKKFPLIKNENVKLYNSTHDLYEKFYNKYTLNDKRRLLSSFHIFYLFTFLSGSDSSGILNNFQSNRYPLPFNQKELIAHFVDKNYSFADKWIPKRCVMDILKEDKAIWNILKQRPNTPNASYLDIFYKIGERLNLKDYCNRASKIYGIDLPYCYNSYHLYKCLEQIWGNEN